MSSIFVSYRREGGSGFAGRIEDDLERRFGAVEVFRDVDDLTSGEDFVEGLDSALQRCRVLLVVIGKTWLTATNAAGGRRLDDPRDFVRQEITAALTRGVRVVPVLVEGSQMPAEIDLPDDLKPLARRQAHELSDSRWDYDIGRLAGSLEDTVGAQTPAGRADGRGGAAGVGRRIGIVATAAVVALAAVAWFVASRPPDLDGTWDMPNGSYWIIQQADRDLTIQEVHYESREVWKKGTGTIDGDSVAFRLDLVFNEGYYTEGQLQASADAQRLTGSAITYPRKVQDDVLLARR